MVARVLVPIADATEEIELSCVTDVLVRAGVEVVTASVMADGRKHVRCARGLRVEADVSIAEAAAQEWDAIALPGGMPGAKHLSECAPLIELIKAHAAAGKLYGAICAAPAVALAPHGLLPSTPASFTHFPAAPLREKTDASHPGGYVDAPVVRASAGANAGGGAGAGANVITSQGPGTALAFGLALVEALLSREAAQTVADGLLHTPLPA